MEIIDNEEIIDENQQALDLLELHGGYKKASKASGIPIKVLNERQIVAIERGLTPADSIIRRNKHVSALSETSKLVIKADDVDPQDIIDDVLRVYKTRENKVTEATYKQFGRYSKDVWGSIWHRFVSLQKAAGIKVNRHQLRTDGKLARYAEDEIYANMDNQRKRMEDIYNVEVEGKYATILCGSDFHDKFCDPFFRRVFIETARQMQPDIISLVGDMLDMYEFSSYHKSSEWINVQESFVWLTEFLRDLREACPDTQIDFLEGNHELRMWKSLCENDSIRQLFGDWGDYQLLIF